MNSIFAAGVNRMHTITDVWFWYVELSTCMFIVLLVLLCNEGNVVSE